MKKTLAILLALLMTSSIALVSCENNSRTPNSGDWDDENDYVDESDDGTSDTSNESGDSTDSGDEGNNSNPTGWIETNDTVYVGVNVTLRTEPSNADSVKSDKKVTFGTAINRLETNYTWDKVSVDGSTYYIKSIYIEKNGNNFKFTDVENGPVTIEINPANTNKVVFYRSPFFIDDPNDSLAYLNNAYTASGILPGNLAQGYTLKKLAVSANGSWVKVEFTGKLTFGTTEYKDYETTPGVFYIQAKSFNDGRIVDNTWSTGGGNNDNGYLS